MKNYVQRGDVITWTNDTGDLVKSGEAVTLPNCLAVAVTDIDKKEEGALRIEGAFDLPIKEGDTTVIGQALVWDSQNDRFTTSAASHSDDLTGAAIALQASANDEEVCKVKLTPGNVKRGS